MSARAFHDLLIDNSDSLKPYAFNLTKDNEAAKDLMQETLYKALANREKYLAGTNVKAWMYTIMRNLFINNYRKRRRKQAIFNDPPIGFYFPEVSTGMPGAEMGVRMKELNASLYDLPQIFRFPFQMYFEGYKYNEIASLLDEPLGTIKSRIHFARKLLKEQMKGN